MSPLKLDVVPFLCTYRSGADSGDPGVALLLYRPIGKRAFGADWRGLPYRTRQLLETEFGTLYSVY